MFSIKSVDKSDIQNIEYEHGKGNSHVILENESPIAYVWFEIKDNVMDLGMIEVVEKGKGLGTKIIHFLLDYFSLEKIEGFVLCEERAYRFWDSLGGRILLYC